MLTLWEGWILKHELRTLYLEGGLSMNEKACEDYECRSCGRKMVSVNFVTGICIQVFVSHGADCSFYHGNPAQRTKEVTCETCRFYDEIHGCAFDGEHNSSIESVRTAGDGGWNENGYSCRIG